MILMLMVAIILLAIVNLFLGSVRIPMSEVCRILLGDDSNVIATNIIFSSRLPQALTAIVAGAGLAVSGLQMQTVFRNPLAGPSVLGISNGSALGVAFVVLLSGKLGGVALSRLGYLGDGSHCRSASRHDAHRVDCTKGERQRHPADYWCDDWLPGQCHHWRIKVPVARRGCQSLRGMGLGVVLARVWRRDDTLRGADVHLVATVLSVGKTHEPVTTG